MKFERSFEELEIKDILTASGEESTTTCDDPFVEPGFPDLT